MIIAANWKMNKTETEITEFFDEFFAGFRIDWLDQAEIVIFPQTIHLAAVRERVKDRLKWGLQNCLHQDSGAFTGEVSPLAAARFGAQYTLVGHSERRQFFGETDESVGLKVEALARHGVKPMVCVGESLSERESGKTNTVIERQVRAAISRVKKFNGVIAYEPVWAIGTGKNATPKQVEEAHQAITATIGPETPVIYGGSVKPATAGELAALPSVGGFLVGGASLAAQDFLAIIEASLNA